MLRALLLAPQVALLVFVAYSILTSLPGLPRPARTPSGQRHTRFLVLVPAHDEAAVIDGIVCDLLRQDYPRDRFRVVVVADRCSDDTAAIAAAGGAEVLARNTGAPGKGPALAAGLAECGRGEDAVVVLDADNRVPAGLLARFDDEVSAGATVVQAYLDTVNPGAGLISLATALTYWAGNRAVQLARSRLGWSVDLGGTGMCLTTTAMDAVGGFGGSLTEDQELAVRLVLAGQRVDWIHDVRVRDEKPRSVGVAVRQRARWVAGRRTLARQFVRPLLAEGWRRRSWEPVDVALRLLQPGRSFIALISAVLVVMAIVWPSTFLLPATVWAGATIVQLVWPLPFLVREDVPVRYLLAYPVVTLIAALWAPIRIVSRLQRGWYHTPHG
jgi:cellulose synthase/poly-beta-1,6-N-acetylglucosamine synthase-like glycosyltransferase